MVIIDTATIDIDFASYKNFSAKLSVKDVSFIPISALHGDNVVSKSNKMDWYGGSTLLYHLENVHIGNDNNLRDARFPVQTIIRPHSDEFHDYRGYAGRVAGGIFRKGQEIIALPSGFSSKIKSINFFDEEIEEAQPQMSVTITLEDEIDISRGDMIVRANNQPKIGQDIECFVAWMDESKPLKLNGKYALKHTTKDVRCIIKEISYKMDINNLSRITEDFKIELNDIGRIKIRTTKPLFYDTYRKNRLTGSFILIDEATNITVGACMII